MAPDEKPAAGASSSKDESKPSGAPGASMVDIRALASILMQQRGPIIDRLGRALPKFSGDGTSDVSESLDRFENLCKAEIIQPTEVIDFLLEGNAARVFRALRVSEASEWDVVKAALVSQYGMGRMASYHSFASRKLRFGEAVDVYVDDLRRVGARIDVLPTNMVSVLGIDTPNLLRRYRYIDT